MNHWFWAFSQTHFIFESMFCLVGFVSADCTRFCFIKFPMIYVCTWPSTCQCTTVRLTLTLFHHHHHLLLQSAEQVILGTWMCFVCLTSLPPLLLQVYMQTLVCILPLEIWTLYCWSFIVNWIFVLSAPRKNVSIVLNLVESKVAVLGHVHVQQCFLR